MADVSHPSSLNLEPNPFEQSFASNTQQGHPAAAASNATPGGATGEPGAASQDPNKHIPQQLAPGANGLDQKTPIPGIDKMLTPLPLPHGAPPFGPAGQLTSQLGVFGASSPAGWLPPRFGPITPGALNTPSLDAFGNHHTASVQAPQGFPHIAPRMHVQVPGAAHGSDVSGLPRSDAFGRPTNVIPLGSPGINTLAGANTPGVAPSIPGVHGAADVALRDGTPGSSRPTAGLKPQGENAAANGLYMLSQNQLTEKTATAPLEPKQPQEPGRFSISPETKRRDSQHQQHQQHQQQQEQQEQEQQQHQPPQAQQQLVPPQQPSRKSVDSIGSSSADEHLASIEKPEAHRSRPNSSSRKRSIKQAGDEDDISRDEAGPEDEQGEKRRWTNSQHSSDAENEEKRKQFLERNRIAAIKCRARKKQWVDNLQQKVDMYARANDELAQKSEKMRIDFEELRQFILRYHNIRSLPQHILHIVQGADDAAANGSIAPGHDFHGMSAHVLPAALPGAIPAPPPPLQSTLASSVPSTAQSMTSSMVPSPLPQRTAPARTADPRYPPHHQPHAQSPQSHFVPPRPQQAPMQQPPQMQHIHQTSE